LPAVGQLNIGSLAKPGSWERTHLNVVTRVGVIVAVAIACVIVAVLTSAYRADEVALEQERQLFSRAIADHGGRVLREVESVTATDRAVHNIRIERDSSWIQQRLGQWLETNFDREFVFVVDEEDRFLDSLSNLNRDLTGREQMDAVPDELRPLATYMRGHTAEIPHGTMTILRTDRIAGDGKRMAMLQRVAGKPAFVAVTEIRVPGQDPATLAPFVMAVKFLNADVLWEISGQLQLPDLRAVGSEAVELPGRPFALRDDYGQTLARFAWTPKQPGSRIMRSVIPFVTVAVAGFAVLALFVLRYMRRTAAAIAAGEDQLRHLAMHDPLSGLPNRTFFGERLEAVIGEMQSGGPHAAVFYIDLDHFKDVNDTLGHPVGDELIRNVTLRLNRILRGKDMVARLGGDEFAVIISSAPDAHMLQAIAPRIIASISAPYSINGQNIVIGASIGIAVIDQRTKAATDIMRYADIALYRAKNEGRQRACIYDAAMDEDLSSRKLLEADLRHAIENGVGLYLAYQPIVNNSGEKIVGVEALARWKHPERGEIRPVEFIPVAEDSGLITALGEWVLRRACLDGKSWPGTTVAVNVSPLQFRRTDFVDTVKRILAETKFDAARLELEVTESTFLGNVATAEAAMGQLKNIGVQLALDDFGTGYSSLLYLRRFPFDKLKIDQSFTASIETAADAAAIVHAIVSLGRGLGMKVTAEGVETAEQALFLRAAGVHTMQGYRYGKPMPNTAISEQLVTAGRSRALSDIAIAG
jgi:diguanylate cyclase (GGDEF)-like protein